tara:strand:+ start:68363 stop:68737 length:375 start_codon:yes stop_codon:yes gene_type:complete
MRWNQNVLMYQTDFLLRNQMIDRVSLQIWKCDSRRNSSIGKEHSVAVQKNGVEKMNDFLKEPSVKNRQNANSLLKYCLGKNSPVTCHCDDHYSRETFLHGGHRRCDRYFRVHRLRPVAQKYQPD